MRKVLSLFLVGVFINAGVSFRAEAVRHLSSHTCMALLETFTYLQPHVLRAATEAAKTNLGVFLKREMHPILLEKRVRRKVPRKLRVDYPASEGEQEAIIARLRAIDAVRPFLIIDGDKITEFPSQFGVVINGEKNIDLFIKDYLAKSQGVSKRFATLPSLPGFFMLAFLLSLSLHPTVAPVAMPLVYLPQLGGIAASLLFEDSGFGYRLQRFLDEMDKPALNRFWLYEGMRVSVPTNALSALWFGHAWHPEVDIRDTNFLMAGLGLGIYSLKRTYGPLVGQRFPKPERSNVKIDWLFETIPGKDLPHQLTVLVTLEDLPLRALGGL